MHYLLRKLLDKRGIQAKDQLEGDEKKDFERWETILGGGEMTIEKLEKFCEAQIQIIEERWKPLTVDAIENNRLVTAYTIYRTLLKVLKSPSVERETLEKYLTNLIST